jgi:cell division protein DivIC
MKKQMKWFEKYALPWMKNKYVLTFLGFLIWLSFFDKNDFITTSNYRHKLHELQKQKAYYEEEIRNNRAYLTDLMTNRRSLEKFGREKYFMKKDNEDVFVIVDERKLAEAPASDN